MAPGDEPPLDGAQCAQGKSRERLSTAPGRKKQPGRSGSDAAVEVSRGERTVQCCEEQHCVGAWNVRSVDQGKLEVVKQEMARLNMSILGISGLRRMGRANLTQMTSIPTAVGKNPLQESE